jgi:hypothetical protein
VINIEKISNVHHVQPNETECIVLGKDLHDMLSIPDVAQLALNAVQEAAVGSHKYRKPLNTILKEYGNASANVSAMVSAFKEASRVALSEIVEIKSVSQENPFQHNPRLNADFWIGVSRVAGTDISDIVKVRRGVDLLDADGGRIIRDGICVEAINRNTDVSRLGAHYAVGIEIARSLFQNDSEEKTIFSLEPIIDQNYKKNFLLKLIEGDIIPDPEVYNCIGDNYAFCSGPVDVYRSDIKARKTTQALIYTLSPIDLT